jgi:hypothetical protein
VERKTKPIFDEGDGLHDLPDLMSAIAALTRPAEYGATSFLRSSSHAVFYLPTVRGAGWIGGVSRIIVNVHSCSPSSLA